MIQTTRFVSLVFCLAAVGCATHIDAKFNRGLGLNGEEVLIIPFKESTGNKWFGESERGEVIATRFKQWAFQNSTESYFVEGEVAKQAIDQVRDVTDDEIDAKRWKRLTAGLGVKFVLVGDLVSLSKSRPGVVNYYDGRATATFRVIDVFQGRLAYEDEVEVRYGGNERGPPRFTSEFDDPGIIEANLLRLLAARIGKDCYGYEDE